MGNRIWTGKYLKWLCTFLNSTTSRWEDSSPRKPPTSRAERRGSSLSPRRKRAPLHFPSPKGEKQTAENHAFTSLSARRWTHTHSGNTKPILCRFGAVSGAAFFSFLVGFVRTGREKGSLAVESFPARGGRAEQAPLRPGRRCCARVPHPIHAVTYLFIFFKKKKIHVFPRWIPLNLKDI